mmetsp:Transcript_3812/g.9019  ORF Transcript_3812/g.9019 Transcript_3812/m.9019 type:complete len:179 (+) Transcript_3812:63-599(+)
MLFARRINSGLGRRLFSASSAIQTPPSAPRVVPNLLDGRTVASSSTKLIPVHDPATNKLVCHVPESTPVEMAAAVESAARAFKTWRDVPVQRKQRVMFELQGLIRASTDELAASITREQGKTLADARGDVFRGLEVVESACGVANGDWLKGQSLMNLATGLDCVSFREPLGVTAVKGP